MSCSLLRLQVPHSGWWLLCFLAATWALGLTLSLELNLDLQLLNYSDCHRLQALSFSDAIRARNCWNLTAANNFTSLERPMYTIQLVKLCVEGPRGLFRNDRVALTCQTLCFWLMVAHHDCTTIVSVVPSASTPKSERPGPRAFRQVAQEARACVYLCLRCYNGIDILRGPTREIMFSSRTAYARSMLLTHAYADLRGKPRNKVHAYCLALDPFCNWLAKSRQEPTPDVAQVAALVTEPREARSSSSEGWPHTRAL